MAKNRKQKNETFLSGPDGVSIRRHHVDGDIRYTILGDNCQKLVGLFRSDRFRNGRFVWKHRDYR